jgi:integrase
VDDQVGCTSQRLLIDPHRSHFWVTAAASDAGHALTASNRRKRLCNTLVPGCFTNPYRHGERVLAIDTQTAELLRAHRAWCTARAEAWGGTLAEDAYLFAKDEAGRHPVRRDTMGKRFGKLAAELGHGYTVYGLRHFMATQLGAVATAATVRERMGHGSLAVTGLYVHRVSEADHAAARHMSDLLDLEEVEQNPEA